MTRNRCVNYLKRERVLRGVDISFLLRMPESEMLYNWCFHN